MSLTELNTFSAQAFMDYIELHVSGMEEALESIEHDAPRAATQADINRCF